MISILCIHKVNNKIKLEKDFYQIYRNGIQFRFYFTPNKLIFILYIFRNGISVAKGNSILPTNVPAIILRRKIQLFQFLFLIPFLSSRHLLRQQLATNFSSVSNFCSNICFPFLFCFYSVCNFRNGNDRFYFPFLYRYFFCSGKSEKDGGETSLLK